MLHLVKKMKIIDTAALLFSDVLHQVIVFFKVICLQKNLVMEEED